MSGPYAETAYVSADFPARPADRHPDTLAWVALIEAVRLEDVPKLCPTCKSTVTATQRRVCSDCRSAKLLAEFPRNRAKLHGRAYHCRSCTAAHNKARRAGIAISRLQRHLWEAAS